MAKSRAWSADPRAIKAELMAHRPPDADTIVVGPDGYVKQACSCKVVVASGQLHEMTESVAYEGWVEHYLDVLGPS
jgi:hypothetical protein